MSLRVKLTGTVLLVALMLPLLGGLAINRMVAVSRQVTALGDATPALTHLRDLEAVQRDQQAALLAYDSGGASESLQRFREASQAFDAALADLRRLPVQGPVHGASPDLIGHIEEQQAAFETAAAQLLDANTALDRSITELRSREGAIVQELTALRRSVPATTTAVEPASSPSAVGAPVDALLLGIDGLLYSIERQASLAAKYAVAGESDARRQLDAAPSRFDTWLAFANAAGGAEDRALLASVQARYANQFQPAVRAVVQAADASTTARAGLIDSGTQVTASLAEAVQGQIDRVTAAESRAKLTVARATRLLIAATVAAFLLAVALGVTVAGRIARPLLRLRDIARQVSRGDIEGVEVDVYGRDEVGDLADSFRRMMVSIKLLMAGDGEAEGRDTVASR